MCQRLSLGKMFPSHFFFPSVEFVSVFSIFSNKPVSLLSSENVSLKIFKDLATQSEWSTFGDNQISPVFHS